MLLLTNNCRAGAGLRAHSIHRAKHPHNITASQMPMAERVEFMRAASLPFFGNFEFGGRRRDARAPRLSNFDLNLSQPRVLFAERIERIPSSSAKQVQITEHSHASFAACISVSLLRAVASGGGEAITTTR